jgi:hypothetical protein
LKVPARLGCLCSLAYLLSIRYSGIVNHGKLCFFFIVLDGTFFFIDDLYSIVYGISSYFLLNSLRRGFATGFVNYKKGALDSQPHVIKFTSCLPMVGGFLGVLQLLPPRKLVAMI